MNVKVCKWDMVIEGDYKTQGFLYDVQKNQKIDENIFLDEPFVGSLAYNNPLFIISDNKFSKMITPAKMTKQVYYCEDDEYIYFADDFFCMCKKIESNFIEVHNTHFEKLGELPSECTWHPRVRRLKGYSSYSISNGSLVCKPLEFSKHKSEYQGFKDRWLEMMRTIAGERENVVLLSGGVDSKLIALSLKCMGKNVRAIVAKQIPEAKENDKDVKLAVDFCDKIGIRIDVVQVDYDEIEKTEFEAIVREMPDSAHLSLVFYRLLKSIKNKDAVVWCGQNADNLYNLGPSGRIRLSKTAIFAFIKRLCLTEELFKAFKDCEQYSIFSACFFKPILFALCYAYKSFKKLDYCRLPKSIEELLLAYSQSYDDSIFVTDKNISKSVAGRKYGCSEVKEILFRDKVENYCNSAASAVVDAAARLNGISSVCFPYSLNPMIDEFFNIRLRIYDVLKPKKYLYYMYMDLGRKYGLSMNDFEINSNIPQGYHEAAIEILHKTKLGTMVGNEYQRNGDTGIQTLTLNLNLFWEKTVERLMLDNISLNKEHS